MMPGRKYNAGSLDRELLYKPVAMDSSKHDSRKQWLEEAVIQRRSDSMKECLSQLDTDACYLIDILYSWNKLC